MGIAWAEPLNEVIEAGGDLVDDPVHEFRRAGVIEQDRGAFPGADCPPEFEVRRPPARQYQHERVRGEHGVEIALEAVDGGRVTQLCNVVSRASKVGRPRITIKTYVRAMKSTLSRAARLFKVVHPMAERAERFHNPRLELVAPRRCDIDGAQTVTVGRFSRHGNAAINEAAVGIAISNPFVRFLIPSLERSASRTSGASSKGK
jgi:hypothetical protein